MWYKNGNTKNKSFRKLPELFGMSAKQGIQKAGYRIHLTDPFILNEGFTHWSRFLRFSLHFFPFISGIMAVEGSVSSKLIFLNNGKNFIREGASLCLVPYELLQTNLIGQTSNLIQPFFDSKMCQINLITLIWPCINGLKHVLNFTFWYVLWVALLNLHCCKLM